MGNTTCHGKSTKQKASIIESKNVLNVASISNVNQKNSFEKHPSSNIAVKDIDNVAPSNLAYTSKKFISSSGFNNNAEKMSEKLVSKPENEDLNEEDIIEQHLSTKNFVKDSYPILCLEDLKIKSLFKDSPSKALQSDDKNKAAQSNLANISSSDQSKNNNNSSITCRATVITEFLKNPDFQIFSSYLNKAFTNNPSLAHINFIILTLLELSEDEESTWETFATLLSPCYEYIKNWKQKENSEKLYQKIISEMLPIIDQTYQKKKGTDIPILSTLINDAKNFLPNLKYLPVSQQLKTKILQESFESLVHRVNFELKKIEKKADSLHYTYLNEFLNLLNSPDQRNNISKSLNKCRFDKRDYTLFLSHSIILGADSGIYVLLNTLSEHEKMELLKDSHINHEMINLIMNSEGKIVIGEGSFGKIRMAMAIIPNKKSDTSLIGGNIICVKKAGSKRKPKEKQDIWSSTWNDYCSIDFLEDAPEIFDMKITKDCLKKLQGYCFQKLLMLPNGDIFKKNEEYQTWVHVKQYFIGIFQLMIKLHERGICMTDLKPANTLYDKRTRTAKVVDLAGAVRNENLLVCKIKHVKETTPKYTAPELLDENIDDPEDTIDLTKCISWTIGYMMEEICSRITEFKEATANKKIQRIKNEINSLINELKLNASDRITLEEGLKRLIEIPDLNETIVKTFESYMNLLKKNLQLEDPKIRETLNLKNDIYTLTKCFNNKLKVTARNPEKYIYDPSTDKSISDLLPEMKKMLEIEFDQERKSRKEAVILFGSAGSGKSTILQKMFIEAAQSWKIGDPIPIFMNLAIHYDLKDYWRHLQDSLEMGDLEFEDLIKQPLLLFLDSLDESRMDLRVISNISDSLSTYANVNSVKMMVTCRTGYLDEENEENRIKENIQINLRYIIPLDYFFFNQQTNIEELIDLYLHQWENRNANEIRDLVVIYLKKIKEFRLQEIMKTTYMVFMILAIMPKLMKIDPSASKQNINFLTVYELYLEKNLENEISRSTDEAIKKKDVAWFLKVGMLLAESMMLTKKATNQIGEKESLNFLEHPLLAEIGENYSRKYPLTENFNIYNILRTLNLNIHFQKKPPNEEITLSFPHDTIKNYFLTKSFEQKLLSGDGYPEWISSRSVVNDQNLIRFMVEGIKSSSNSKITSTCEKAIFSTKQSEDPKVITRAANLITFLVASNYSFYGKDLSDIKINGANISDGIFHACNFDRADLSGVILNNVKMDRASFKKTNLKNVIFDIYPYFEGHSNYVNSVAFSPDGKKLLSGSEDKTVRIWDVESGKELKKYEGHSGSVSSVAFSPDGKKIVSGSGDKTIRLWDVDNKNKFKKIENYGSFVRSVAFSPDGKKVVSGSYDDKIRIWDIESGERLQELYGHTGSVRSIAFSPDGKKFVSGSSDCLVMIWDLESGKALKTYKDHSASVYSVGFSPDGKKVVSGSVDKSVRIWNVDEILCNETAKYEGHNDVIRSVSFSPDGKKVVSGSEDKTIRLWDVESGKELKKYEGHSGSVSLVAFSPDGRKIVSGSEDKTIRLWDVENQKDSKKYEGHISSVNSVVFSPDGKKVVSGSSDNTVRLWDGENGKELKKCEGHSGSVFSVAFSLDGKKVVSGSGDSTVRIWEVETGKELIKFEGHNDYVRSVAFSPDGKKVVSGSEDKTIRLWDLENGKELKKYEGHSDFVRSVAFSPDGNKVVSGSGDSSIRLWDVESGKELQKYEGHSSSVYCVAFSSDQTKLVSGSFDNTVRVWDIVSGRELKKYEDHSYSVRSTAFSPDGKKVVSGSGDTTIKVWDVDSGKKLKKYEGHSGLICSVAFSPDGKKIVSGSEDKTIRFWDFESDEELKKYKSHSNKVNKNSILIISSSPTVFSCLNCYNFEDSLNCSIRLMSLFKQNH